MMSFTPGTHYSLLPLGQAILERENLRKSALSSLPEFPLLHDAASPPHGARARPFQSHLFAESGIRVEPRQGSRASTGWPKMRVTDDETVIEANRPLPA